MCRWTVPSLDGRSRAVSGTRWPSWKPLHGGCPLDTHSRGSRVQVPSPAPSPPRKRADQKPFTDEWLKRIEVHGNGWSRRVSESVDDAHLPRMFGTCGTRGTPQQSNCRHSVSPFFSGPPLTVPSRLLCAPQPPRSPVEVTSHMARSNRAPVIATECLKPEVIEHALHSLQIRRGCRLVQGVTKLNGAPANPLHVGSHSRHHVECVRCRRSCKEC